MSYHMDKETNSALIRLLDALCEFERGSGRESTLILIPHNADEKMLVAQSGKPVPTYPSLQLIVNLALEARTRSAAHAERLHV